MGPAQQKQSQNLYFKQFDDQLLRLKNEFNGVKSSGSEISETIKEQIKAKQNYIIKYSRNSKIYIVFMGTSSSGKSTFINSLLGQKLLPTKNQNCTSKVIYINHQDAIVEGRVNIDIDGVTQNSLREACETLKTTFENPGMNIVKLKTQSYYHQQFSKDLQDRIVFVDTPGINLSEYHQKDYFNHFCKINELIQLDEYSIRLNIWVFNYASFDNEKKIQKQMQYMVQGSDEQNLVYQANCDDPELINRYKQFEKYENKIIQQSTDKKNSFFFIMNKFDLRNEQEDNKLEKVIQDVQNIFNSENIFKISGEKAYQYNVMNYGSKESKQLFYQNEYDKKRQQNPQTKLEQVIDDCIIDFKKNNQLIQSQDYNSFIQKTSKYIMDQLYGFINQNLLNSLDQEIALYQFMNCNNQQLSNLQKGKLNQFMSTFQQKKQDYAQELQPLKENFLNQITELIEITKMRIKNFDPKYEIKKTCKISIEKLETTNKEIQRRSTNSIELFICRLKMELESDNIENNLLQNILMGCEQIFLSSMEDQFEQCSRQLFQTYSTELYSKMGMTVKKYKLMYPLVILAYIFLFFLDIQYTKKIFNQDLLVQSLDEWNLSLKEQTKDLIENYIRIYSKSLDGIQRLMEQVNR